MGIKDFLARLREKKEKYNSYAEERKIEDKYAERLKSSNERELERFMKEDREDNIKKELEEFRRRRKVEGQHSHQILKTKNMFDPKLNKKSILKNDNIFLGGDNMFAHERSVFLR